MNPQYCDLRYFYKGYERIDDMLRYLEAQADSNINLSQQLRNKRVLDSDFISWWTNTIHGHSHSFDSRVFDVRNYAQSWMDNIRIINELTDLNHWYWTIIDSIKALFRGKIRSRRKFVQIVSVAFTEISRRLEMLDGGLEENDAYVASCRPASLKLLKHSIGFNSK